MNRASAPDAIPCGQYVGTSVARLALWSAVAALAGSCTQVGIHGEAQPPTHEQARQERFSLQIAQVGYGPASEYRLCTVEQCPETTPKTVAPSAHHAVGEAPMERSVAMPAAMSADRAHEPSALRIHGQDDPSEPEPTRLTVNFETGQAALTQAARATLDAALPLARTARQIVVSGRTDIAGGDAVNTALALARALAVRKHLRDRLPDLTDIIAIDARGRCCFIADNDSVDGRARNRRVDIVLTPKGPIT